MTKVIKGEFEKIKDVKVEDVSLTCNTSLEIFNMEVSRLSRMDNDLFTYKVKVANIPCNSVMDDDLEDETDDDMGYDPSEVKFIEWLRSKIFNHKTMDQYTIKALWIYWIRGDDEVELTDEESSDDEDEIAEVFRIDTNIFDYETPICSAFNEFNYLLKVDPDLLTKDITGFKTYDDYKNDWIYEWNKDVPWVDEKPWTGTRVWTESKPVKHTCEPFNYKTGCSEWPTCSWKEDGYCNGGNLPGTYIIENQLHYQDYEWYEALDDCELKEEALRNKAIMDGVINNDESCCELKRKWNIYTNYDDAYEINHEDNGNKELCEIHEPPVCNIRKYMMIKYSFNDDEEYVAVKEDEYDDLIMTRRDTCQAYQEIFRIMDEGWMVTRATWRKEKLKKRPREGNIDEYWWRIYKSGNLEGNPHLELQEKGVINSGCSRHMTGNKSYLSDYEEIDGGFVAFGGDPKGGRITSKGKISTGGLTCLFAKAMLDESNLWHRRLGHKNLIDLKVKVIRCDNGTEFKNKVMNQFYDMKGIKRDFSVARTPQQNRVLVIKPHNKTPYVRFLGRKLALRFMRPFGCLDTILNTLDHLVEENLHVKFSEETHNIVGNGPNWLFDIDALTISMNYKPVVAGNQTDGNACTKEYIDAGQDRKKLVPDQKYILLLLLTSDPLLYKSLKDSLDARFKPSREEEKMDSEHPENEYSEVPNTEEPRINQEHDANVNITNNINTVSPTVNVVGIENNVVNKNIVYGCIDDPNMPNLEEIVYFDDDEEVGAEADMNNLATTMPISLIPTTGVHKDHPLGT
ncbi:VIER F-box protein 2 [Tanacetum coccineum]